MPKLSPLSLQTLENRCLLSAPSEGIPDGDAPRNLASTLAYAGSGCLGGLLSGFLAGTWAQTHLAKTPQEKHEMLVVLPLVFTIMGCAIGVGIQDSQ